MATPSWYSMPALDKQYNSLVSFKLTCQFSIPAGHLCWLKSRRGTDRPFSALPSTTNLQLRTVPRLVKPCCAEQEKAHSVASFGLRGKTPLVVHSVKGITKPPWGLPAAVSPRSLSSSSSSSWSFPDLSIILHSVSALPIHLLSSLAKVFTPIRHWVYYIVVVNLQHLSVAYLPCPTNMSIPDKFRKKISSAQTHFKCN